jgi:hypothetical protein
MTRTMMTRETALRRAWGSYVLLSATPAALIVAAVLAVPESVDPPRMGVSYTFFGLSVGWMVLTVPLAFWLRGYVFRAGWQGQRVDAESYLRGLMTMWTAAASGATLAAVGCLAGHSLLPCLFPAGFALVLMLLLTPSGRGVETPGADRGPGRHTIAASAG